MHIHILKSNITSVITSTVYLYLYKLINGCLFNHNTKIDMKFKVIQMFVNSFSFFLTFRYVGWKMVLSNEQNTWSTSWCSLSSRVLVGTNGNSMHMLSMDLNNMQWSELLRLLMSTVLVRDQWLIRGHQIWNGVELFGMGIVGRWNNQRTAGRKGRLWTGKIGY